MGRLGAGVLGSGVLASGCARAGRAGGATRVVCTTSMIGDAARTVAGARIALTTLMGAGVDPHLYKPTRTDTAAVMGADVVFYNGLLLEGRMQDLFVRAAGSGRRVTPVCGAMREDDLLHPAGAAGHPDPHVWMDPNLWSEAVEAVRGTMAEAIPAGAREFEANAAAYAADLRTLDAQCAAALGTVPVGSRVLVTAHDAFGYFGRRYGFEVMGIQGISTDSEAGLRDIERLVEVLVTRRVPAVFIESTISDRGIRALVEGAAARGHEVRIGASLFSDAAGVPGTYEGTHIGMLDHNVTSIVRALGGEAPETGLRGRLGKGG
ncbi:MAG: zinc ABC transporter substrate-binding protein [Phycisphaerales bacterium]|nr:zinc ABC transporter substrate-binding protein [Phycisphaerales bacterium]